MSNLDKLHKLHKLLSEYPVGKGTSVRAYLLGYLSGEVSKESWDEALKAVEKYVLKGVDDDVKKTE
jgi:hypothetical protein